MAVRDTLEPPAARHLVSAADLDPEGVPHGAPAGTPEAGEAVSAAQTILDHSFDRPGLLAEALTHRSAAHGRRRPLRRGERRGVGSNERLEFIGDRVLGLVMAEWLIERFPDEQEGELGPRHAHLVSRKAVAEIAQAIGLSRALAVAPNEARAGVGQLATVLADAMEAVIGALYLDGGLPAARRFVRRAWQPDMDAMVSPPKDPKTALQEWLMARAMALPDYRTVTREGPSHAPLFVIEVAGAGHVGTGRAGSKRLAEREAAADLLAKLAP